MKVKWDDELPAQLNGKIKFMFQTTNQTYSGYDHRVVTKGVIVTTVVIWNYIFVIRGVTRKNQMSSDSS